MATILLRLFINNEQPDLVNLYKEHVENHNKSILNNDYANSGFDIFIPTETKFVEQFSTKMINMEIKAEMVDATTGRPCAYYVYPRSSMSKTPLMLANHTGIIDSGYRGFLIGAFRCLTSQVFLVEKHSRLLQICHPSLCPIKVEIVDSETDLSRTNRGIGGFGSTGVVGKLNA